MPEVDNLMSGRIAADDDFIIDKCMATKARACCELAIVVNVAVMAHMRIGHEVIIVADACWLIGFSPMSCEALAEDVFISNHDSWFRLIMIEAEVLWRSSDAGAGVEDIAMSDLRTTVDPVLPQKSCAGLDGDRAGNEAVRSDDDVIIKMNVAFNDRGWMNGRGLWHGSCASSYHGGSAIGQAGDEMEQVMQVEYAGASVEIIDLGRMPYAEALAEQRRRQAEVIESRATDSPRMDLLIVEHDPPVITISNRPGAREHLLASEQQLSSRGVEVHATDRGGDITWHGPGQVVLYPILDLNRLELRLHGYLRWLEEIVIQVLSRWQITGHRDCDATGVWVGDNDGSARKICAMGVRVSRWVTMHGLALNVKPDLSHFELIVPCGLVGRSVTSLEQELGAAAPSLPEVKEALRDEFIKALKQTA